MILSATQNQFFTVAGGSPAAGYFGCVYVCFQRCAQTAFSFAAKH
jgi:hypothetical protein